MGPSNTAFGDRSAPFLLSIESNWERLEDDGAALEWGRAAFHALEPFAMGAEYLNFPGLYEDNNRMVRGTFGSNLARLVALKQAIRPNQPPPPDPQHQAGMTVGLPRPRAARRSRCYLDPAWARAPNVGSPSHAGAHRVCCAADPRPSRSRSCDSR